MKFRHFKPCAAVFLFALLAAGPAAAAEETGDGPYAGKTILWVDSYHAGYEWSDGIERGVREVLAVTGATLRIIRLDTKRRSSEEEKASAALAAKAEIDVLRPDAVIASDDNANKYLTAAYLKNTDLPVVFCGVNWDASMYGFPCDNVTGMVEVEGVPEMVNHFKRDARGDRIGYVSGRTDSDLKITQAFNARFFDGKMKTYFASTFAGFQAAFLKAQAENDMLFVRNHAGLADWDPEAAETFLLENTRVPTGSHLTHMDRFVIYTMGKIPEEQGAYAARTALGILDGARPGDIPLVENKKARLAVNLKMARAAGVVIPVSVLKTAELIGQKAYD